MGINVILLLFSMWSTGALLLLLLFLFSVTVLSKFSMECQGWRCRATHSQIEIRKRMGDVVINHVARPVGDIKLCCARNIAI